MTAVPDEVGAAGAAAVDDAAENGPAGDKEVAVEAAQLEVAPAKAAADKPAKAPAAPAKPAKAP